jgi:hypothetical protein
MPRNGVVESEAMSDALSREHAQQLLDRLRELIAALDARVPHLERKGEVEIASDAAAFRTKALDLIAGLEKRLSIA